MPGGLLAEPSLTRLFEELSNPVRLSMLRSLTQGPGTVTALSGAVGLSPQEVSRHLARLAEVHLVERGPARGYRATPFGRVLVEDLPALEALMARKTFFQDHRLDALPPGLPMRPVAAARHHHGAESDNLERVATELGGARQRAVFFGNQIGWVAGTLSGLARAGVEVEVFVPWTLAAGERLLGLDEELGDGPASLRLWLVDDAPLVLATTESAAYAFFGTPPGPLDLTTLVGGPEQGFRAWADDLLARARERAVLAFDPARDARTAWRLALTRAAAEFVKQPRARAPAR